MKKYLLSAVCSVGLPFILCGALQETALFPVAPGTKALPVQTEAVHPDFKESPYEETGKVPEFTPAEKRSGMMIFSRPLTEPVYQATLPKAWERVESLHTFGARGQIVTLNFAVYPVRNLKKLRTAVQYPFPGGQIRQIAYWKVRYPFYLTPRQYRTTPGYLFPATWCDAKALEPQRFVVNVKIPDNAAPGIHSGTIRIAHDGYGKALVLPYTVKVFPFELQRDPAKNFSAYASPVREPLHKVYRKHKNDAQWLRKASLREFRLMKEYGFTRPPAFGLHYNKYKDKFEVPNWEIHYAEMREAGLPLPMILVTGDHAFLTLYRDIHKAFPGNHLENVKPLSEDFYKRFEKLLFKFKKEWEEKKYPPIVFGPKDEPCEKALPIIKRLYQVYKKAGYRTFMTSCPFQKELNDYVDFWHDLPFRSFEEVQKGAKKEYWCYPGHICYEYKDSATQNRGGRMTYGFGLWRSNYNFLMPWIWRYYFNEHLLTTRTGGGGHLLTDEGDIIIELHWENFREGIFDGRYIYTLQQSIVEREPAKDPELKKLLVQGRQLLQDIWDSLPHQQVYLAYGHFNDREFDSRRLQMAEMIAKIKRFPAVNKKKAPSILVDTSRKTKQKTVNEYLELLQKSGNLDVYKLNPRQFMAMEKEATLKIEKDGTLHLHIGIDRKQDGTSFKGNKYLCGWPRMTARINPVLDFRRYGFFRFRLKVDSNRDGEKRTNWQMRMDWRSVKKVAGARSIDLPSRMEPGVWQEFLYSTADILKRSDIPMENGKAMNYIQFWIREAAEQYEHGDKLDFRFADMAVFRVKRAVVKSFKVPQAMLNPVRIIPWEAELLGSAGKGDYFIISLADDKGKILAQQKAAAAATATGALEYSGAKAGKYKVTLTLFNAKGEKYHSAVGVCEFVNP
ncbi:MAG: hypothetical protein E7048_10105 [Lentisphaerae bacterium]|nr:hypothetical protein [Lentisphaerota bacterium]